MGARGRPGMRQQAWMEGADVVGAYLLLYLLYLCHINLSSLIKVMFLDHFKTYDLSSSCYRTWEVIYSFMPL